MHLLLLLPCASAALLGGPPTPYPKAAYDPQAAAEYFARRPALVAERAAEIIGKSAGFAGALISDAIAGKRFEGPHAAGRAQTLVQLISDLGPTFIKIGQSASVRADLLPPSYVAALVSLQEDVPPFSTEEAKAIIGSSLPRAAAQELLANLPAKPMAAASLGQVYKSSYEGKAVAVKVQRPQIAERVALDMHLIRSCAPIATLFGAPGDILGIVDAWGQGFVAELDYSREAANSERFNADFATGPLAGGVFAPAVVHEASCARVLTSEWIEGERLDQSTAREDVPRLCSLAMNCFLAMMLETGALHCDPHPGNLLRTRDGRLCILDWGLVQEIEPDLQLTLIEHVAHITAKDYAKIPGDLVRLDFVPAGLEETIEQEGITEFIAYAYAKRAEGGGFATFNVPEMFDQLNSVASQYSSTGIFQIPPYFAYIAKAFAVLEGIGLGVDPRYSIINECLPYISSRIIRDPSPRMAGALSTFVFGEAKDDRRARVLDAERVSSLLDGAGRYAASSGLPTERSDVETRQLDDAVDEAADVLLDVLREDTPAARLIIEQLTLIGAAASRELWADLRQRSGRIPQLPSAAGAERSVLGALVDPLGLFRSSAIVNNDERDRQALDAAAKLASLASDLMVAAPSAPAGAPAGPEGKATVLSGSGARPSDAALRQLARALVDKAWKRRDDVALVSRRLVYEALDQTTVRLAAGARAEAR